jgi:hypothetical protein
MQEIPFLTPAQEELIPEYQKKWERIGLLTDPIHRIQAQRAIKGAYAVMGKPEPEVIFCTSPQAALEHLQGEIPPVKPTNSAESKTPEESQSNVLQSFLQSIQLSGQAIWQVMKLWNKQKQSGTKPLHNLLKDLSDQSYKAWGKHIENSLPENLSTQDVIGQAFLGTKPMFELLNKQMARQGHPQVPTTFEEIPQAEWQASLNATATNTNAILGCLPFKGFFFRIWLKNMLKGALSHKICGITYPFVSATFMATRSPAERQFLLENPAVFTSDFAYQCTCLDFAFSILNYPHDVQKWSALKALVKCCGWIFAVQDRCIVCDRPYKIRQDEDGQLHGEGKPAVEFADGFALYAHHGNPLPEKYGTVSPQQWQTQWVLAETNQTWQQVLIQGIGATRLCQELPMTELDQLQEYVLLQFDGVSSPYSKLLKRTNPETNQIQAVFVSEKSVRAAIAYANQAISPEDFPMPTESNTG